MSLYTVTHALTESRSSTLDRSAHAITAVLPLRQKPGRYRRVRSARLYPHFLCSDHCPSTIHPSSTREGSVRKKKMICIPLVFRRNLLQLPSSHAWPTTPSRNTLQRLRLVFSQWLPQVVNQPALSRRATRLKPIYQKPMRKNSQTLHRRGTRASRFRPIDGQGVHVLDLFQSMHASSGCELYSEEEKKEASRTLCPLLPGSLRPWLAAASRASTEVLL